MGPGRRGGEGVSDGRSERKREMPNKERVIRGRERKRACLSPKRTHTHIYIHTHAYTHIHNNNRIQYTTT